MNMDKVRVGIIGVGNMGSAHAHCIYTGGIEGLELAALCDISPARQQYCREAYPGVPVYACLEDMLKAGNLDAAIVAVPHPSHSDIAMEVLRHDMHVLVEKPIDVTLSKARALCDFADTTDKKFAVMLNWRTHPLFRKAKEIIQSGQLGELKRSVWIITNWYRTQYYYDSGTWRATWKGEGGGVLLNQAPHNLDLWQWMCGMPDAVQCNCAVGRYHRIEVEDEATILTRYANGATGAFLTSTGEAPGTNRLEIDGDLGKLLLENGTLTWWKLKVPEREFCFTSKESFVQIPYDYYEETDTSEPEKAHPAILQNWTNAILHGEALISPGRDALNELAISNAAYLSQWTGNGWIELPPDAELFDKLLGERIAQSALKDTEENTEGRTDYSKRWQVNW